MLRKSFLTGCVLTALLITASTSGAQDRIAVYLKHASGADGFTDANKARQDSLKDLAKRLRDSKVVRVTETAEDAAVTLEVLARETHHAGSLMATPQNASSLTVRLTAGEYTTDFTGESGSKGVFSGYGAAAKQVVKQFEAWVTANRERLTARGAITTAK